MILGQITMKPQCSVKLCENNAIITIGSNLVCGKCAMKWQKKQDKIVLAMLEEE